MRRPGVFGLIVVIAAFCVLIGLGVWQVKRLHWKTALLERIAAAQTAPAEPLDAVLRRVRDGIDVGFVRVQADCLPPDPPPTRVYLYGLDAGRIGWRQIAPCRIANPDFDLIAVDRGFVTSAWDAPRPPPGALPPLRRVTGVLREPDRQGAIQKMVEQAEGEDGYRSREHARLAVSRLAGGRIAPVVLIAEQEDPARPELKPAPLPVDIPNNHLGYAITWFGLAAALAGVYLAMLLRRRPS